MQQSKATTAFLLALFLFLLLGAAPGVSAVELQRSSGRASGQAERREEAAGKAAAGVPSSAKDDDDDDDSEEDDDDSEDSGASPNISKPQGLAGSTNLKASGVKAVKATKEEEEEAKEEAKIAQDEEQAKRMEAARSKVRKLRDAKFAREEERRLNRAIRKAGEARRSLKDNQEKQAEVAAEIADTENHRDFEASVNSQVTVVANETQSQALADFVGDTWKEMRMMATPFYKEHLQEEVHHLKKQEVALAELADHEQKKLDALTAKEQNEGKQLKEGEDKEDKEVKEAEDKKLEAEEENAREPKKAKTEASAAKTEASASGGRPVPVFNAKTMPAVSPTLKCVMCLTFQFFLCFTLLAICRTLKNFSPGRKNIVQVVEAACSTVFFAPMLCVLFLGVRMRAIQLTQGQTEQYGLPQWWVQWAMYASTLAVLGQIVLVLLIPVFTGKLEIPVRGDGGLVTDATILKPLFKRVLKILTTLLLIMLYAGSAIVCIGAFAMQAPKELWPAGSGPPVSPAVQCTMLLAGTFFAVYFGVALTGGNMAGTAAAEPKDSRRGSVRSRRHDFHADAPTEEEVKEERQEKLQKVFLFARYTVNFAPMLSILFIAARLRALQLDPKNGDPQLWAQRLFYICTYSVMLQAILVVVLPMVSGCELQQGDSEGDVVFVFQSKALNIVGTVARYLLLLLLYAAVVGVVMSVILIQHPMGAEVTPPLSPELHCIVDLAFQYFFVWTCLFVCQTLRSFLPDSQPAAKLTMLFEAGSKAVVYAPMLSMLFIGARMRALQLTRATDGSIPSGAGTQPWAQEAMYVTTWSVLIQVLTALVAPVVLGFPGLSEDMTDDNGMYKPPAGSSRTVFIVLSVVNYACLLAMYGGVVLVMVSICWMTPGTLPPYSGYNGLVPGAPVPPPASPMDVVEGLF